MSDHTWEGSRPGRERENLLSLSVIRKMCFAPKLESENDMSGHTEKWVVGIQCWLQLVRLIGSLLGTSKRSRCILCAMADGSMHTSDPEVAVSLKGDGRRRRRVAVANLLNNVSRFWDPIIWRLARRASNSILYAGSWLEEERMTSTRWAKHD